jgi:hypothetical protein
MPTPGAAKSTQPPLLENQAKVPLRLVALTATEAG